MSPLIVSLESPYRFHNNIHYKRPHISRYRNTVKNLPVCLGPRRWCFWTSASEMYITIQYNAVQSEQRYIRWKIANISCSTPVRRSLCSFSFHFTNAFTATSCSHMTAWLSAEWRRARPSENLVCGHESTMWLIVCTSPQWHVSDVAIRHLWRLAAHMPWPLRNWFSNDHVERRSN